MNKKTTVIVIQTEENGKKETKSFQQPWAFVLCAPIFQVTAHISSG